MSDETAEQAMEHKPGDDDFTHYYKCCYQQRKRAEAAEAALEQREARVAELERTVVFFTSVIKSGESWSDACQQRYAASMPQNVAQSSARARGETNDQ